MYEEKNRLANINSIFREKITDCAVFLDENKPELGWETIVYDYAEDLLCYMHNRSEEYPNQEFYDLLEQCSENICGYHAYDFYQYKCRFGHSINDDLFADLEDRAVNDAKELLESI